MNKSTIYMVYFKNCRISCAAIQTILSRPYSPLPTKTRRRLHLQTAPFLCVDRLLLQDIYQQSNHHKNDGKDLGQLC